MLKNIQKNIILMFALSTCVWCKKTRRLLDESGIKYECIEVDLLIPEEQKKAYKQMKKYNSEETFPTIIVNEGKKVIIGYVESELKSLVK